MNENITTVIDVSVTTWIFLLFFCSWGGMVRYLMGMIKKRKKWNFLAAIYQVIISAFTGLIGSLLCLEYGSSLYKVFVVAGIFSTLGSSALIVLWRRFFPELGKDK